jgi:hypothetical protein
LQWLQPTPEISAHVALHLPPLWRWMGMDGDAMSSTSLSTEFSLCEALSDASTSLSHHNNGLDVLPWQKLGMAIDGAEAESSTVPPSLTPRVSSLPITPPPPAYFPLDASFALMPSQTPSPTFAHASSSSSHLWPQPSIQPRASCPGALPTLLGTAGSFAALGAWSTGCNSSGKQDKSWRAADMLEHSTGPSARTSAGSVQHSLGKCRPCAFFHRPDGCTAGSICSFCHTCEPGEKKRRQKQKFERIQQRRQRRVATSALEAMCEP